MSRLYSIAFLACIVAANFVTTEYGMVPVGFGLMATAGTYFAGLTFVLRDSVQDAVRRSLPGRPRDRDVALRVMALILAGAGLSYMLAVTVFEADPAFLPPGVTPVSIALASGVAFLVSELADLLVYTPLRSEGYVRAAVASNVVGAVVDTILFLWIAGFVVADAFAGQVVGKVLVTVVVVVLVLASRGVRRVVAA
jgi:uncharacterized PurR-regulated membrane protein YhhQ (DUF165 family)